MHAWSSGGPAVQRDRPAPHWAAGGQSANPLEMVALWIFGLLAVVTVLVWGAGEISARVFSGVWPHVSAAEMGGVIARLRRHIADPAQAWPRPARHWIPGALEFYATLGALVIPLAFLLAFILYARASHRQGKQPQAAEWASPHDLKLLRVSEPQRGRLTLGRVGGRLVAAEARQSVIVVGPTQTGKTTGFAVPAILEWGGPVVATSVKTDLLDDTIGGRSGGGDVFVYDPSGSTGAPSAGWTPLGHCTDWQGAQRMASWLVAAARQGNAGLDDADFWYSATAKLLAPVLLAAASRGNTISDVIEWIDTQDDGAVLGRLDFAAERAAVNCYLASRDRDDKTKSGIYATAETVLMAYADPVVAQSALSYDLTAERLLDGGRHTAYICAPTHEQQRLRPILTAVVQEIIAAVYERAARAGKPLDPPLLLVLDECANIAPLRELAALASTGAGQGIQLVSVFQDLAQVSAAYGRDKAPTIVSNHRAKVILTGISDSATLDYVGRLLGDEEVRLVSSTSGHEGQRSSTESTAYRSLAPANVLRQMRPGEGVLVYGHLSPARLTLRPWYEDKALSRLAQAGEQR